MRAGTSWDRLRRLDPVLTNGVLAAFLFAIQAGAAILPRADLDRPVGIVALVLWATVPIAFRRRAPVPVLWAVGSAVVVYAALGYPENLAPSLAVAAGSAASWSPRATFLRWVVPSSVVPGVILAIDSAPGDGNWVEIAISLAFGVGLPLLIGRILHHRRLRLERDRVQAARDAVTAERARIARELHDVVAHAVSVMVVQAGAARTVLEKDPDAARRALREIERTGRTGLTELRRLLDVLKTDADEVALAPQPGLEALEELLARFRATGLPVEATVEGVPRPLAPGVDLTAYRVVQEALTNALKHAGGAHAHVRLRYGDRAIDLEVEDDGRGPTADGSVTVGHGLLGMRERVAVFGGSLEAGERRGGGFVVRARIPTDAP